MKHIDPSRFGKQKKVLVYLGAKGKRSDKTVMISVPSSLLKQLNALANGEHRKRGAILRVAVERHLRACLGSIDPNASQYDYLETLIGPLYMTAGEFIREAIRSYVTAAAVSSIGYNRTNLEGS